MAPQARRDRRPVTEVHHLDAGSTLADPRESPGVLADFEGLRLAAILVDLEDLTVRAITAGARAVITRSIPSIVGRQAASLVDPADRSRADAALAAMRSGAIEFYRAHYREVSHPDDPGDAIWAWAKTVELDGRRYALIAAFDPDAERATGTHAALQQVVDQALAVGVADADHVVVHVGVEPRNPLDINGEALVGMRLADEPRTRQIRWIEGIGGSPEEAVSFAFPVQVPTRSGSLVTLTCVLTLLAGSSDRLFILSRPPNRTRTAELERRLLRIAAEVEASGVLVGLGTVPSRALGRHPQAASLTLKQWEILRRLAAGERVPTIARDLYLSPSTVRNHLSAIFDRFGVHSQAELLSALARSDALPG